MKVAVYGVARKSGRDNANRIGQALKVGFKKHGIPCEVRETFDGEVIADVALAYGWLGELTTRVFSKYKEAGKRFVFFDLGYWARGQEGHYRLGVDDWDTALKMTRGCPSDRFDSLKVNVRDDWNRESKKIMIVGMSGKAAWTHGYSDGQWENETRIKLVKELPDDYHIHIRQKPNKQNVRVTPIEDDLRESWFVVSHHSNVAVDALVAGVPYWAKKGVGAILSPVTCDAQLIGKPFFPTEADKMQLLYDIAYAQWTPAEMRNGDCWNYIKGILG